MMIKKPVRDKNPKQTHYKAVLNRDPKSFDEKLFDIDQIAFVIRISHNGILNLNMRKNMTKTLAKFLM